jgi:hypothetical protein
VLEAGIGMDMPVRRLVFCCAIMGVGYDPPVVALSMMGLNCKADNAYFDSVG